MSEKTLYRTLGLAAFLIACYIIAYLAGWIQAWQAFRISMFTIVIPVVIGWISLFRWPGTRALWILLVFLTVTLGFDVVEFIWERRGDSNLFLMEYYSPVEYTLLTLVFASLLSVRLVRRVLLISIPAFLAFWAISHFSLSLDSPFDNTVLTVESILLCGVAILTLIDLVRNNFVINLHPGFWIIIAVLIYFAGNLIFFAMWNLILPVEGRPEESHMYWFIHHVLNMTMHLLYSVSFLCRQVRTTS
jgi:hypothetical protein